MLNPRFWVGCKTLAWVLGNTLFILLHLGLYFYNKGLTKTNDSKFWDILAGITNNLNLGLV